MLRVVPFTDANTGESVGIVPDHVVTITSAPEGTPKGYVLHLSDGTAVNVGIFDSLGGLIAKLNDDSGPATFLGRA